ncbi:hypothetical protein EZV62_026400 [Acer yangbiense]|uniref:Uncharacterized protein n=1 Tax=Acer yangbiense TaxID=1000413 RepID=A0A5C7GSF7_9ROSI|nr:hypothetical protein EZV62_026400 [Acer yangbiense]
MTVSTVDNQRWLEFKSDIVKGTVMFSLKFTSDVKYRKSVWDTIEHRMRVKCDVGLGPDGYSENVYALFDLASQDSPSTRPLSVSKLNIYLEA